MSLTRWVFDDTSESAVKQLQETLGVSRLAGAALACRGIVCKDSAARFIDCDYPLQDAMVLKDMRKGAERVRTAIESGERVAVFGDYDVDGIMSTAIMTQYLESAGADVVYLLPARDGGGYGLTPGAVDEIAALQASLIITVDNGISSHEAIAHAAKKGIDTIVCDHHKLPKQLPKAVAVIDPLRTDDESSFKHLAGAGLALKFAAAIEDCSVDEMLEQFGYFAAIGTIADVMPLVEENRVIVARGLSQLAYRENPGLSALMDEIGLNPENITAQEVAFSLAPRLNAAGRMANAEIALKMLLTDDRETASAVAGELSALNIQRQDAEQEMTAHMIENILKTPGVLDNPILVVSGHGYNSGVSGIVCSRLVERFGKPTVVISIEDDIARASGRSVEGFSLYNAIDSCRELLTSFGGHDMAAGFTLPPSKIESFNECVNAYYRSLSEPLPRRQLAICAKIEFSDIGEQQISELLRLAPFGPKNEEPVFATLSARIEDISPLGGKHCRLTFEKRGKKLRVTMFNKKPEELFFNPGDVVDIAYVLSLYSPQKDRLCVSAKLKHIVPEGFSKEDFRTLDIFDRMQLEQELTEQERSDIAPSREDMAQVYRSVKNKPLDADDQERIYHRFSGMAPGRAAAAIQALKELGIFVEKFDGRRRLVADASSAKRELEKSAVYAKLHGI